MIAAVLAVSLLVGMTVTRYIVSADLRSSVVVNRVTGNEAIKALPPHVIEAASCPCKVRSELPRIQFALHKLWLWLPASKSPCDITHSMSSTPAP